MQDTNCDKTLAAKRAERWPDASQPAFVFYNAVELLLLFLFASSSGLETISARNIPLVINAFIPLFRCKSPCSA